tara:strand:- start:11620 stop:12123 length:504 start_codon:yes stop_codon:yes gene_type:complete
MQAQQLLDYIIKPALEYMGGNYNSKNAQMLLLATAAIESKCGYYIKQINGPALGIWQMEPATLHDIYDNCDAVSTNDHLAYKKLDNIDLFGVTDNETLEAGLLISPMYACAMARLKYSMDKEPLPEHDDIRAIYREYKRIYNTYLGKSTYEKFEKAYFDCGLDKVVF